MEKEDARFDRRGKKVVNGVEKVIRSTFSRELGLSGNMRKKYVAQSLIQKLSATASRRLNMKKP